MICLSNKTSYEIKDISEERSLLYVVRVGIMEGSRVVAYLLHSRKAPVENEKLLSKMLLEFMKEQVSLDFFNCYAWKQEGQY